jgi:hypothetical protein
MAKITLISFTRCLGEFFNINIPVHTAINIAVHQFQQCRKILFSLWLASSGQTAIKMTAVFSMIPDKSSNMHHTRAISCGQCQKHFGVYFMLESTIPNSKTLFLDGSEMSETGKYEGINIFWIVGPRNKTSDKDVPLLVLPIRGEYQG